jgi:UDP-N-acetylmuramoylalanine--D-glutamate ligase
MYNDTNATTPEATMAALEALGEDYEGRIVLIMGGADKGLVMDGLLESAVRFAKRIVLLAGTGTERIQASLPDAEVYDNLAMAFADARAHADSGDIILFSPAFSSFGMFTNEYDRGDQFMKLVTQLESSV